MCIAMLSGRPLRHTHKGVFDLLVDDIIAATNDFGINGLAYRVDNILDHDKGLGLSRIEVLYTLLTQIIEKGLKGFITPRIRRKPVYRMRQVLVANGIHPFGPCMRGF